MLKTKRVLRDAIYFFTQHSTKRHIYNTRLYINNDGYRVVVFDYYRIRYRDRFARMKRPVSIWSAAVGHNHKKIRKPTRIWLTTHQYFTSPTCNSIHIYIFARIFKGLLGLIPFGGVVVRDVVNFPVKKGIDFSILPSFLAYSKYNYI